MSLGPGFAKPRFLLLFTALGDGTMRLVQARRSPMHVFMVKHDGFERSNAPIRHVAQIPPETPNGPQMLHISMARIDPYCDYSSYFEYWSSYYYYYLIHTTHYTTLHRTPLVRAQRRATMKASDTTRTSTDRRAKPVRIVAPQEGSSGGVPRSVFNPPQTPCGSMPVVSGLN